MADSVSSFGGFWLAVDARSDPSGGQMWEILQNPIVGI
jgi:hypothetical protein